jgi:hypothetical protein
MESNVGFIFVMMVIITTSKKATKEDINAYLVLMYWRLALYRQLYRIYIQR